jgi:hypothetical protein
MPLPQIEGQMPQMSAACETQTSSHSASQQKLSTAQTALQQLVLSQPGVPWGAQQLPTPGHCGGGGGQSGHEGYDSPGSQMPLPQIGGQMPQMSAACETQTSSHPDSQQKLSTAHTALQQLVLSQPGVACGVQQLPALGHTATGVVVTVRRNAFTRSVVWFEPSLRTLI